MFLSIDESFNSKKMVLGGIVSPISSIPKYEKHFAALRIEKKIFGEVKWTNIDQYSKRYTEFLDIFLNDTNSTYHSICYSQNAKKYHAAYTLIRTVTWKIENYCRRRNDFSLLKEPFYVLFDNDEEKGRIGTKEIKKIKEGDRNFKIPLYFCNQGASHVIGHLQLTDLLTGAISYRVNNLTPNKNQKLIIDHIIKKNEGIDLNFSADKLPGLYEYKIQMFNPDNKIHQNK